MIDDDAAVMADLAESRGDTLTADAIREEVPLTEWTDLRCSECQSKEHRRRDCPERRKRIKASFSAPVVATLPDYYTADGEAEEPLAMDRITIGYPSGGTWNPPAPMMRESDYPPSHERRPAVIKQGDGQ